MRETVQLTKNGKCYVIGHTSMYAPTNTISMNNNPVLKMLQLKTKDKEIQGDIFFFRYSEEEGCGQWLLVPQLSFISPLSQLVDLFQIEEFGNRTTWDEFVNQIFCFQYSME
ncbi:MAG: hypothetical protein R2799_05670 [Crocinitomicaceae bacterium]